MLLKKEEALKFVHDSKAITTKNKNKKEQNFEMLNLFYDSF